NTAGRERRGHVPYVPTGRPPGRPRKYPKGTSKKSKVSPNTYTTIRKPAPAPVPVQEPAVSKHEDPLPSILVLETTKLRHEIAFKKLVKISMEAQDIEDRELAKSKVEIAEKLIKDRENAKTHEDWCNAKWTLDNLLY
ncbi:unnamed protein product, partial [marine sediment metagenome]